MGLGVQCLAQGVLKATKKMHRRPQEASYNTFNQKAFNKVSFSLYCLLHPQSLLHSSISIPSGKSQLIPSFITFPHLYPSSPICPFTLSFQGTLENSQSIKQLLINIRVFTDQSQPPDRFPTSFSIPLYLPSFHDSPFVISICNICFFLPSSLLSLLWSSLPSLGRTFKGALDQSHE